MLPPSILTRRFPAAAPADQPSKNVSEEQPSSQKAALRRTMARRYKRISPAMSLRGKNKQAIEKTAGSRTKAPYAPTFKNTPLQTLPESGGIRGNKTPHKGLWGAKPVFPVAFQLIRTATTAAGTIPGKKSRPFPLEELNEMLHLHGQRN